MDPNNTIRCRCGGWCNGIPTYVTTLHFFEKNTLVLSWFLGRFDTGFFTRAELVTPDDQVSHGKIFFVKKMISSSSDAKHGYRDLLEAEITRDK